ncbi:hypothetical protein VTI74DRAFT_4523 [Chaetomium olivicolor]
MSTPAPASSSRESPPSSHPTQQQKDEATAYLQSLLNKNLRVTASDGRMFWGTFKCTDSESNLVLQHTYEYRQPTLQQITAAASKAEAAASGESSGNPSSGKVKLDMTSRYLGLVVVPGKYIVKIEAEEFLSQIRGRQLKVKDVREQGIIGGDGAGVAVS